MHESFRWYICSDGFSEFWQTNGNKSEKYSKLFAKLQRHIWTARAQRYLSEFLPLGNIIKVHQLFDYFDDLNRQLTFCHLQWFIYSNGSYDRNRLYAHTQNFYLLKTNRIWEFHSCVYLLLYKNENLTISIHIRHKRMIHNVKVIINIIQVIVDLSIKCSATIVYWVYWLHKNRIASDDEVSE